VRAHCELQGVSDLTTQHRDASRLRLSLVVASAFSFVGMAALSPLFYGVSLSILANLCVACLKPSRCADCLPRE
jgi:hypothetical protein